MKKFLHRIWNILRYPRGAFLLCFYALFALTVAGTVLLLIFAPEKNALHYILYALSAVGLGYFVYTVIIFAVPEGKACAIRFLQRHSFTDNILKNYGFRTLAFAAAGLIVNIAYAVWLTVVGVLVRSVWNIAIAVFYFVLIVLKGIVFFCDKKYKENTAKQIKTYRSCGYMLNLLTVALVGIVILINKADMSYEYAGYMIYIVAAYTFYKIITAIIHFFKARRRDGLIVQAIRNINLVDAIYSVFVLQVSMIPGVRRRERSSFQQRCGRRDRSADFMDQHPYDRTIVPGKRKARSSKAISQKRNGKRGPSWHILQE